MKMFFLLFYYFSQCLDFLFVMEIVIEGVWVFDIGCEYGELLYFFKCEK